jgi:hypothetical protein
MTRSIAAPTEQDLGKTKRFMLSMCIITNTNSHTVQTAPLT